MKKGVEERNTKGGQLLGARETEQGRGEEGGKNSV